MVNQGAYNDPQRCGKMPGKSGFPESILVETTLRCPADCVFCPNKKIDNRPVDMSWQLFKKIIDTLDV